MITPSSLVPPDPVPADAPSGAPVANAKIEQSWLRELERAQGQQRAADSRAVAQAPDAKGARADGERAAPRPAPRGQGAGEWLASRAPRAAGPSASTSAPRAASPRPLAADAGEAAPPTPAGRAADARPAPDPALAFEAEIAARLWGAPRKWEPRRVHARARAGRVWIWIRDADFDASHTARVTAALAALARDAGLELEGITVNGHVVFGDPGDDREATL